MQYIKIVKHNSVIINIFYVYIHLRYTFLYIFDYMILNKI